MRSNELFAVLKRWNPWAKCLQFLFNLLLTVFKKKEKLNTVSNKLITFNFVLPLFFINIIIIDYLLSEIFKILITILSNPILSTSYTRLWLKYFRIVIQRSLIQWFVTLILFCSNIYSSGLTSAAWKCIILQKLGYKVLFRLKSTSKSRSFLKKTGEDLTRDWKRTLEDLNEFSKLYCIIF